MTVLLSAPLGMVGTDTVTGSEVFRLIGNGASDLDESDLSHGQLSQGSVPNISEPPPCAARFPLAAARAVEPRVEVFRA